MKRTTRDTGNPYSGSDNDHADVKQLAESGVILNKLAKTELSWMELANQSWMD